MERQPSITKKYLVQRYHCWESMEVLRLMLGSCPWATEWLPWGNDIQRSAVVKKKITKPNFSFLMGTDPRSSCIIGKQYHIFYLWFLFNFWDRILICNTGSQLSEPWECALVCTTTPSLPVLLVTLLPRTYPKLLLKKQRLLCIYGNNTFRLSLL